MSKTIETGGAGSTRQPLAACLSLVFALLHCGCSSNPAGNANGPPPSASVSSVEEVSLPEQGRTAQLKHVDGIPTFNIDKIQDTRAPFENPSVPIAVLPRRNLIVQGWAIDKAGGKTASAVDIAIDGIPYQATYGSARPEIVQFFKNSAYLNSGFSLRYPTGHLSSGPHNLTVRVVLVDGQLYSESPALTLQVP